jgi:hypothetical protein
MEAVSVSLPRPRTMHVIRQYESVEGHLLKRVLIGNSFARRCLDHVLDNSHSQHPHNPYVPSHLRPSSLSKLALQSLLSLVTQDRLEALAQASSSGTFNIFHKASGAAQNATSAVVMASAEEREEAVRVLAAGNALIGLVRLGRQIPLPLMVTPKRVLTYTISSLVWLSFFSRCWLKTKTVPPRYPHDASRTRIRAPTRREGTAKAGFTFRCCWCYCYLSSTSSEEGCRGGTRQEGFVRVYVCRT